MMINEMEKQKITPTEVRFICKEMKGMSLIYKLVTPASKSLDKLYQPLAFSLIATQLHLLLSNWR